MKIQYASDLHLEFPENWKYMQKNPLEPPAEILVLAGDIMPIAFLDKRREFIEFLSQNWRQVFWVPGNHEFYGSDIKDFETILEINLRQNVTILNNKFEIEQGVRFMFSTLWSKISIQNSLRIQKTLSDFGSIHFDLGLFTPEHYNVLHQQSLRLLRLYQNKVDSKFSKTLIVTHHVPTFKNYPAQHKGDFLNEAFGTELFDLIEELNADAWIFGHHHENVKEFKIGNTRMLTNQLGYKKNTEGKRFRLDKTIEL